ncbi:hypothetical protein QR680_001668 [Steinernema hermaphroditum]|uniref:Uncharacterized protein n=1 Tax=Steinernema hermaphroditum TaxID=289476 RepID=A0AA39LGF3_9BILA|nr:hypothetical protein QR680_001668 [Steinernema hermaphroditum]
MLSWSSGPVLQGGNHALGPSLINRHSFGRQREMSHDVVAHATSPEHECVDLLLPERRNNNLAMSSTQGEMPSTVQTADKPVVLMLAPAQITNEGVEETRRRIQGLHAK